MGRYRVRSALYTTQERTPRQLGGKKKERRPGARPYRKDDDPVFTRKRRPKNLSPDSLHRLLRAYDQVKREDKPGAVRNLAAEFGIDRGSIARIAARVAERGTLKPKPKSGRKVIARDEDVDALREFARARNFDFTYREVEAELRESNGWTRGTARRWFQRNCEGLKIRRPADSKNKERSWKAVEEKLALRQAEKAAAKSSDSGELSKGGTKRPAKAKPRPNAKKTTSAAAKTKRSKTKKGSGSTQTSGKSANLTKRTRTPKAGVATGGKKVSGAEATKKSNGQTGTVKAGKKPAGGVKKGQSPGLKSRANRGAPSKGTTRLTRSQSKK
eukprot:m.91163 g.91163  ORF g.91163 m.91163 type:complete len:329 (+) comp11917_c0_seq1:140-1126(+)